MIRASAQAALLIVAASLAACQSGPGPMGRSGPSIDGQWTSGDGISVTAFQSGQFTTRFVKNNELLAQGSYTATGGSIAMQWLSFAKKEQQSANCSLTGPNQMRCIHSGGDAFDLNRAA